jgi:hypothetical protein
VDRVRIATDVRKLAQSRITSTAVPLHLLSLNHSVGAEKHRLRNRHADVLGSSEIDELKLFCSPPLR